MAIEHNFYMDATASRHELRDTLLQTGIEFRTEPDWSVGEVAGTGAASDATILSIFDNLSHHTVRPDNGVTATRRIGFRETKKHLRRPELEGLFEHETTLCIMALLRAYPDADAYWLAYDADVPLLLRRDGRLVVSGAEVAPGGFWNPDRAPTRALVDLPHVVEPLGPWKSVPSESYKPAKRQRSRNS